MNKLLLSAIFALATTLTFAQQPGDTVVVNTINYESTTRDTMVQFPVLPGVTFEKIIMQYSMRCKDGKVSTQSNRNQGCGEWDYSCNTYVVDSSRVDSLNATTKSHLITGFSGTSYDYVTQPYFNLYQYIQTNVNQTIISETQSVVNTGTVAMSDAISADENSGRSQFLYTQTELMAAGVVAGNMDGIMLTAQNTSSAKFLRVRVKETNATNLNASTVDTTGFMQVYFADYNFITGANRVQFYTPFNWDGTSNLIFEFSFTNSTPNSSLILTGENTSFTGGLIAKNGFNINTATGNYLSIPVGNLTGVSNEISFSFWARGDAGVATTKTSVIFGVDAAGQKTMNVHLPWSNGHVYFDCGNSGGNSYDRIEKLSSTAVLEGSWNHWAFTKNANTGSMKIYLNGVLFHSGTGKTRTLDIQNLVFGANTSNSNFYEGDLDELRIWDTELTQAEVQDWMYKSVDSSHPKYANLVAYYPLNEGTGNTATDMATGTFTANFSGDAKWNYARGRELNKFFTESTNRPNLTVLQGNYTLTNTPVTVNDSLQMVANNVKEYQIFSKSGTLKNDSIGVVSNVNYWAATNKFVYDGMTGAVISSTPITKDGTITITDLQYLKRSAMNFEIMSFVTPYGIGLDLGMEGKTWSFDVTDYTPFLTGSKRFYMTYGGQWQEDIDIKFLFIVGTPVRDVLDISQIWKVRSVGYAQLLDNSVFAPRDVMMSSDGKSFKVRSMITGHGQEGEFIGRNHSINIDGASPEFSWQVWKTCGDNPIYPQGGTWIYDRAGWCPGMATLLTESDITSYVTPGQTSEIDYQLSTASGDSRYIVNNQLVTYGEPNHSLDVSVLDIIAPSNKVEYSRTNQTCIEPTVRIQNTGTTKLKKVTIKYWVNGSTTPETYVWEGGLDFMKTIDIVLPSPWELWYPVSGAENEFHVEVSKPNDGVDEYEFNNTLTTKFMAPEVMPSSFAFWFRTNSKANENTYRIVDQAGTVVLQRSGMSNNTVYKDTLNLPFGCYKLEVEDTGGNGISFWANNDGSGFMRFWEIGGGILKTVQPDFGNSTTYNFTVDSPLAVEKAKVNTEFDLYPNPANGYFTIEGDNLDKSNVFVYDVMGQEISLVYKFANNKMVFETQNLAKGMYFVNIVYKGRVESKTVVVN